MNRLILDHYRRWSFVLTVLAAAEFGLGALVALGPQYTYEFWAFLLAMWAGAFLLSFDFQRGLLRPLAVLPLTGRQLGRSWWMATVFVPAVALAGLLFAGAATCCHLRPGSRFPLERLVLGSLFTLVWLGIEFTMIFNVARGFDGNWRRFAGKSVVNLSTVVVFFGSMILCQDASKSPLRSAILLACGALLTAAGWVRAQRFDASDAGGYLGRIGAANVRRGDYPTPLESKMPSGSGGLPFLVRTLFVRGFSQLAFLVSLLVLIWELQKRLLHVPVDLAMFAIMASFMPGWFLIFFQFMSILPHLRLLRTLPTSPSRLAAALLAVALLPLACLGALVTAVGWLLAGPGAALILFNSYPFMLASAALCVFLVVWRGAGTQGYALLLFTLFGSLLGCLWLQSHFHGPPLSVSGTIATAGMLLGFLLTRLTLLHSSRAYRLQADPFGRVLAGQK